MNRSEHGTAAAVDHRHDDLRPARNVEHDPVELYAAAGDLDELACACRFHSHSVLAERACPQRALGPPTRHVRPGVGVYPWSRFLADDTAYSPSVARCACGLRA